MREEGIRVRSCPFCGSDRLSFDDGGLDRLGGRVFVVTCSCCKAGGPFGRGAEAAAAAWNSRPEGPLDRLGSDGWHPDALGPAQEEERVVEASPCPFCGHRKIFMDGSPDFDFILICGTCDSGGPSALTRDGAREAWNRRVAAAH
jgi:Lar family restriction alleviation protein